MLALRRDVPEEAAGGTHRVRAEPGSEPGKLGLMRGKLVRLLVVSDRYDVRVLIAATATTTLFEERVVLHSKVGEHRAALRLIVYELSNTSEAEAYCEEQHLKGACGRCAARGGGLLVERVGAGLVISCWCVGEAWVGLAVKSVYSCALFAHASMCGTRRHPGRRRRPVPRAAGHLLLR